MDTTALILSRRDLDFMLYEWLDVTALTARPRFAEHSRETFDAVLDLAAQWCLEANSLAIQVHGGYGYTRDYDVEQLYRDNRLNPIHEGTHGVQGLDLLGRKMVMRGGAGLAYYRFGGRNGCSRVDG